MSQPVNTNANDVVRLYRRLKQAGSSRCLGSRIAAACAIGLSATLTLSPPAGAATPQTRLVLGGAEYQIAEWFPAIAALPVVTRYATPNREIGAGFFPGSTPVLIDYPASLFRKGTANQHINIGADNLDAEIKQRQEPLAIVGSSEGAVVLDTERARLESDPHAPAPDQLQFVLFASPTRGLVTTLFRDGTHIPFVDITVAPPVESRYDTALVIHEYDFWGDFPDRPWNLITLLNAGMALVFVHPLANDVPSEIAPENITTVVNSKGATDTTYFVPTPTLPLTEVLRVVGVPDKAVDVLDNAIRPVIDAGYSRNDTPGDPRPYLNHGVVTTHLTPAAKAGAQHLGIPSRTAGSSQGALAAHPERIRSRAVKPGRRAISAAAVHS
jgi:hypothetical protein